MHTFLLGWLSSAFALTFDQQFHPWDVQLTHEIAVLSGISQETVVNFTDYPEVAKYKLFADHEEGVDRGQIYVNEERNACVVIYRATTLHPADWWNNVQFFWDDFKKDMNRKQNMCFVHTGFLQAHQTLYYTKKFWSNERTYHPFMNDLRDCLGSDRKLISGGHSQGGAVASLLGTQFALDEFLDLDTDGNKQWDFSRMRSEGSEFVEVHTLGEPRGLCEGYSGNKWEKVHAIKKFRVITDDDWFPSVPPTVNVSPFRHAGAAYILYDLKPALQDVGQHPRKGDWPNVPYDGINPVTGAIAHLLPNYIERLMQLLDSYDPETDLYYAKEYTP